MLSKYSRKRDDFVFSFALKKFDMSNEKLNILTAKIIRKKEFVNTQKNYIKKV